MEHTCEYCETEYSVYFGRHDDVHLYCPACGEQLPQYEENQLDFFSDEEDE